MERAQQVLLPPEDEPAAIVARRRAVCRALLRQRDLIVSVLGNALCPSPYPALLLEIYLAELEGRSVYQSWLVPNGGAAKAHRRAVKLEALGATIRGADLDDNRRTAVKLTQEMRAKLDEIMDRIDAGECLSGEDTFPHGSVAKGK